MENLMQRANQADKLLAALKDRVTSLESGKGSGKGSGNVQVGIHTEVKKHLKTKVGKLKAQLKKVIDENDALRAENKTLKSAKASGASSAKAGGASSAYKEHNDKSWELARAKATNLREKVQALENDNESLKKQVAEFKKSAGKGPGKLQTDQLTQEQLEWLKEKMRKVKSDMENFMNQKNNLAAEVGGSSSSAGAKGVKQTMESIKLLKYYTVTLDLVELKKEWFEAELGELDDEDFEIYLGREVRAIEDEEDDDTINVRFDNHDTQWFPVGCLYAKPAKGAAAPAPAPPVAAAPASAESSTHLVQQTMETVKELKFYFVTTDLTYLKKEWYAAELGELDDEDFEIYLGREVKAIEIEEDDDTINVRFDSHDTQFFPVTVLYQKVKGEAPKKVATPVLVKMTMETVRERKHYTVTTNLAELKKEWFEAELGELDDDDFNLYLGRIVYAIDLEEDDDTMNVRFDSHDTQWFPVGCLYEEGAEAPPAANPGRTKQTMDTIKNGKKYFVTKDLVELKKEWFEAELGELDDDDFKIYLGREVTSFDIEEDDDTVNVRFDNHDSQWFPVGCLYLA